MGRSPDEIDWRRASAGGAGPGVRAVALVLAVVTLTGLAFSGATPPWRLGWFDLLQRNFPRAALERVEDSPVRIVALQENDDVTADRWLWPRDRIARVVQHVRQSGAVAVGLDLKLDGQGLFEIADTNAGVVTGPDRTLSLADSIAGGPVITPLILHSGENIRMSAPRQVTAGLPAAAVARDGRDSANRTLMPEVPVLDLALHAHPALVRAGAGEGMIIDKYAIDSVVRRLPMIRFAKDADAALHTHLSMPVRLMALATQAEALLEPGGAAAARLRLGDDVAMPLDRNGDLWLKLRPFSPMIYRDGNELYRSGPDPAFFAGRIVLISLAYGDYLGQMDTALFDSRMTAELMAQVIEQADTGTWLVRPVSADLAEIVGVALLGLLIIRMFPGMIPAWSVPGGLVMSMLPLPVSAAAYTGGWLIDGAGMAIALLVVGAVALGSSLIDRDRLHRKTQLALLAERAAKSRLEGELDVARRIQMGLLPPSAARPAPGLEVACHIQPARMIGGDFYDHVTRADGRVFLLIADVSGKGVPASLFMALAKSQWKSAALRRERLDQIQTLANREISRDNQDAMFVTGVACLFDPVDATLSYCGAGHDMPLLARPGTQVVPLPEASGPPMGLESALPYAVGEIALQPGDLVCLFTDGLSEAEMSCYPDGQRVPEGRLELFGAEGVAMALQEAAAQGMDAAEALEHVLALLNHVTEGTEQTDDRTIVVLRAV